MLYKQKTKIRMKHHVLVFLMGACLAFTNQAVAGKLNLNEAMLSKMARQSNPTALQIQSLQVSSQLQHQSEKARYGAALTSQLSYSSSEEEPVIQVAPVFQPAATINAGIQKRTPWGLSGSAGIHSEQYTTANKAIDQATQVGIKLGLEIDLWKNLLGRLDQLKLKTTEFELKKSELIVSFQQKQFEMDVRKIYWSLVANSMSQKLNMELVNSAQKQLKEAKKRYRQAVADKGEVARYEAQLSSRQASLLFFDHQKNILESQLKRLLPELSKFQINLQDLDIQQQQAKVSQCIGQIMASPFAPPKNFSSIGEIASLISRIETSSTSLSAWTDSADLKFKAQLKQSSTAKGYSGSIENYPEQSRPGVQLALEFSLPLNPNLSASSQSQIALSKLKARSESSDLLAQLTSEHMKTKQSLKLLAEATKTLNQAVKHLNQSLATSKKKYEQARIDINTLIMEQDNLFNSQLSEIDTKHQVIHLVYDYFKTFDKFPCGINRI
jgi:outer membrane protein TolC